jgi:pentatricopeptide repeat protein
VEASAPPQDEHPKVSQQDYIDLVDFYPYHIRPKDAPQKKEGLSHSPLASRMVLTPEQEVRQLESGVTAKREHLPPKDHEHAGAIAKLKRLLKLEWHKISHDEAWEAYRAIDSNPARYLSDSNMYRLLHLFGFVEHWHAPDAKPRYFQVLEDCIAEGVPLDRKRWTAAIAFAGLWIQHVTSAEVKAAIETWMRMESYGHDADHVILNILFDVAVRAGRFALADTIYNEILARGMPVDRYLRGSSIFYSGRKRDGDGVRTAFREFIEAGEIVDTTVMNAVVMSLLRAGEAPAAEQVFAKMKQLHEDKYGTKALTDWRTRKQLRSLLNQTAQRLREEKVTHGNTFFGAQVSIEEKREDVQKMTPIAPDAATYAILIRYHSDVSGNIERIWDLLAEVNTHGLALRLESYLHILRGFRKHGGYPLSQWNVRRLDELWRLITEVLDSTPVGCSQNSQAPSQDVSGERESDAAAAAEAAEAAGTYEFEHTRHDADRDVQDEEAWQTLDNYSDELPSTVEDQSHEGDVDESMDMLGAMVSEQEMKLPPGSAPDTPTDARCVAAKAQSAPDPAVPDLIQSPIDSPSTETTPDPHASTDLSTFVPMTADVHPHPEEVLSSIRSISSSKDETFYDSEPMRRRRFRRGADENSSSAPAKFRLPTPPPDGKMTMNTQLALAAVRAFYHCCGKARMLEIWDEIYNRLIVDGDEAGKETVVNVVHHLQRHAAVYERAIRR